MLNLTYDDVHLPHHGQLHKTDLQKFFKRMRKEGLKFRYVASGEYGDQTRRPHFHIALFGLDFAFDRVHRGFSHGDKTYTSETVRRLWPNGDHLIGALNFESAAYIARYILKKIKGPNASPLPLAQLEDGELIMPNPEFMLTSKGSRAGQGIGGSWFREYFMSDVYPHASVITRQGTKAPVPRYYKNLLKEVGQDLALNMSYRSGQRQDQKADQIAFENQAHRKVARQIVSDAGTKQSKRSI